MLHLDKVLQLYSAVYDIKQLPETLELCCTLRRNKRLNYAFIVIIA